MSVVESVAAPVAVVALKTVVLALGGTVTYVASKAYRQTGSPALRALAVGFGLVVMGSVLGGSVHQFTAFSLELGVVVETAFSALGFGVLTYSLYTE
ncbi:hypothetical protein NGM10_00890 [Halorussus salilacus]|uniref:DUF7521 family protein n=1 Tax=Halorussus salilacus TaxID=2953750 RepID=UPI00209FFD6B|nr:hypothetical protein [Halorussus salilacus]USZ68312.1 hypothetical protein NGM10_00890 [Halorussus salilacus]